jgi:hypothetical protein
VCGICGDWTKPACDQDPDCGYHCYADEHDDLLDELFWHSWPQPAEWHQGSSQLLEAADRAATPSHMNAAADPDTGHDWGSRRRRVTPSDSAGRS